MPEFHVNLIRGLVPSPRKRRTRYGLMLAYLGISGAALALAISVSTRRMTSLARTSRASARSQTV